MKTKVFLLNWIRKARLRKAILKYPKNQPFIKQIEVNDYQLLALVNEEVGRQLLALGCFEKKDTEFLKTAIKQNWTCLDVGANIGYYTLLFSKLASQGKVYAFEPVPLNHHILKANTHLNNASNVFIENIALGTQAGRSRFFLSEDSGFSSFRNTKQQPVKQVIIVNVQALDNYIKDRQIRKVDFIKIDVEGAEKLILEGAKNVLQNLRPKMMLIELGKGNLKIYNETANSVIDFLKQYGYQPYNLKNNKLIPDFSGEGGNTYFC